VVNNNPFKPSIYRSYEREIHHISLLVEAANYFIAAHQYSILTNNGYLIAQHQKDIANYGIAEGVGLGGGVGTRWCGKDSTAHTVTLAHT
jgi:hypothetical protein